MNFSHTRNLWLRLVLGCGLLAVVAALVMLSAVTHADTSADTTDPTGPMFPPAVSADQSAAQYAAFADRFGLFRASKTEALPADSIVTDPGIERSTVHEIVPASVAELAQSQATVPRASLWVAPRADGTECLLAQFPEAGGPAETCATIEQAQDGYLLMTITQSKSDVELYGLLPDGAGNMTVTFSDGSSTMLPVKQNAYAAHFTKPTASVAFTDANGVDHKLVAGIDG